MWSLGRGCRRRALVVLAALCALRVRLPRSSRLDATLPRAAPHRVAAYLADFNNLRKLHPYIESWRIDSQWSNYTSWRYSLRYSCGARCAGRALVAAHDQHAEGAPPAHGHAARAHRVALHLADCRTLPLLPWPDFCDDWEVEWSVAGARGADTGARVTQAATWRGGAAAAALRWLAGAPPPDPREHLHQLRLLLS